MNTFLTVLIIFFIIVLIFTFTNYFFNNYIEKYGVYCGRYNLNSMTAKNSCSKDNNCLWRPYKNHDGREYGWCDNAPSKYKYKDNGLFETIYNDVKNFESKTLKTAEETSNDFKKSIQYFF
jgi:hypothetical protein